MTALEPPVKLTGLPNQLGWKSKTPFRDWLFEKDEKGNLIIQDKNKFLTDNYIDVNQNIEFADFENFYNCRTSKLESELKRLLK